MSFKIATVKTETATQLSAFAEMDIYGAEFLRSMALAL